MPPIQSNRLPSFVKKIISQIEPSFPRGELREHPEGWSYFAVSFADRKRFYSRYQEWQKLAIEAVGDT